MEELITHILNILKRFNESNPTEVERTIVSIKKEVFGSANVPHAFLYPEWIYAILDKSGKYIDKDSFYDQYLPFLVKKDLIDYGNESGKKYYITNVQKNESIREGGVPIKISRNGYKWLKQRDPQELFFDSEKSRFFIQGNEIVIKKFGNEYHLLNTIFNKPERLSEEWFFSEIAEILDQAKQDDKKYYNAAYQLDLKLIKLGITDFMVKTRQSLKINKKYLS